MKKIIVVGLGLMISACAMFQSEQQTQDVKAMNEFMYCAGAHEKLSDIAAEEYSVNPTQDTMDYMLDLSALSGMEAQYSLHHYYRTQLKAPMDYTKYGFVYDEITKPKTLSALSLKMGAFTSYAAGQAKVQEIAGKLGSAGIISPENYDAINTAFDGKCMMMIGEYREDTNNLMSQEGESEIAASTTGSCVGAYDALSMISAAEGRLSLAQKYAFHSGVMSTFMYAYINNENAEIAYDNVSIKGDEIYSGSMTVVGLREQLKTCQGTYQIANQYTINHVVGQAAQK